MFQLYTKKTLNLWPLCPHAELLNQCFSLFFVNMFFDFIFSFLIAGPRRGRCVAVGSEQRAASSEQRAASCKQRAASPKLWLSLSKTMVFQKTSNMSSNKTRFRKTNMSHLTAFLTVDLRAEHAQPCIWCRRHGHFVSTCVNHNSQAMFSCISEPCVSSRRRATFHNDTIALKKVCFDKDTKLKTRFSKNRIVIPYTVFEGSTCERTLQNHAFGVGEMATSSFTYVIYNRNSMFCVWNRRLQNHVFRVGEATVF